MIVFSPLLGQLKTSDYKPLPDDEFEILDSDIIRKIEDISCETVTNLYITNYENQWYLVAYIEIPDEFKNLCEDNIVYEIELFID